MEYEKALLSPNISWEEMNQGFKKPETLYKYQNFYNENGTENPYWELNMNGEFHMSLGCEFEDINDCKPFLDKQWIKQYIDKFLLSIQVENELRQEICLQLDDAITEKEIKQIASNYQETIRIGCFTNISDNDTMWDKYANMKTGYCIAYDTKKHKLFESSTLPVLYCDVPYNSSLTFANSLILECFNRGKKRTSEENLKVFETIYRKILKTTYVPVFIKQKSTWNFENEYRMFLLKNRNTRDETITMEQYMDEKFNIDLSDAITAIYLGENFENNTRHEEILERILILANNKDIELYHKIRVNGKVENMRIV